LISCAGSTLDLHDPLLAWLGFLVKNHINSHPTFHAQCNLTQGCIFYIERTANVLESTCHSISNRSSFRFQDVVQLNKFFVRLQFRNGWSCIL